MKLPLIPSRWRRSIQYLLPVLFLVSFLTVSQASSLRVYAQQPRQEIRGVWLTSNDFHILKNRAKLQNAMSQLRRLNFNTIYPVVWNSGYTSYPSAVAKKIGIPFFDRGSEGQDILADVIAQAHRQGLLAIPWFEFGFMITAESELAAHHPDWMSDRRDGTQIWQDGIYQRRWLNPFMPEVQQFIQRMILEIVTRYEVDGIQFDDHFGLPAEFGYDDFTQQLYQQEHQGKLPPTDPHQTEWVRWRAAKITDFMTQIFHAIKAQKHDVVIALSPNNYSFSYHQYLQDWKTWERRGLIEELTLQVYSDNLQDFVADLARPEVQLAKQHIPVSIGILTGLKDQPVSIAQIEAQVEAVRDRQFAGLSFFFYESLWNMGFGQSHALRAASDRGNPTRHAAFRRLLRSPASRPHLLDHGMLPH